MIINITDDCINCGACETECPAGAVYPKANAGLIELMFRNNINSYSGFGSDTHYYINPYECNECNTFFNAPRCNAVCPVACCLTYEECLGSEMVKIKAINVSIDKVCLN